MTIVGLTGGLGAGKSTVADMFAALGARIIDADKIVRHLLKKGNPCYNKIIQEFEKGVVNKGAVDRNRLAEIVFGDIKKLRKLEKIIFPYVKKELIDSIRKFEKQKSVHILVMDVPLLFESGFDNMVDVSVVVKATLKNQIERVKKRSGLTTKQIKSRMEAQMPLKEKLLLADIIIDNSGNIERTRRQVEKVWCRLYSVT